MIEARIAGAEIVERDTRTPASRNDDSTSCAASRSRTIALSVTSISSRRGDRPASPRMARMRRPKVRSFNCVGEMLNDSVICAGQARASLTAHRSSQSLSPRIRPQFSAMGMKRSGGTSPWTGCDHRASASNCDHRAGLEVDDRLIPRAERIGSDRGREVALDGVALADVPVHLLLEEADRGIRLALGAIEGDVGSAEISSAVVPSRGIIATPMPAPIRCWRSPHSDGRLERLEDTDSDVGRGLGTGQMLGEYGELVTTEARHQVALARRLAQSVGRRPSALRRRLGMTDRCR